MAVVNFRDVGLTVNRLLGPSRFRMPVGRILRSGRLTRIGDLAEIGSPTTVINLRWQHDPLEWRKAVTYRHIRFPDKVDRYATETRMVRTWLNEVVAVFLEAPFPVLLHCTSGKDRTGVAVAALLTVLGVPHEVTVREYLHSSGEVDSRWIEAALLPIEADPSGYFRKLDLAIVRQRCLEE